MRSKNQCPRLRSTGRAGWPLHHEFSTARPATLILNQTGNLSDSLCSRKLDRGPGAGADEAQRVPPNERYDLVGAVAALVFLAAATGTLLVAADLAHLSADVVPMSGVDRGHH